MATYRKRGSRWFAEVHKHGVRRQRSFDTKAQAVAWATRLEVELSENKNAAIVPDKTFGDLMNRYATEISPLKKGARWEQIRLNMLLRYPIAKVKLKELDEKDFVTYRNERSKEVAPASVGRELSLMSNVCSIGFREWKWLPKNPMEHVRRPKKPAARDRRITDDEIERIIFASGYDYDRSCETATSRVGAAFLFAIETAMRAGEIVKLRWKDVDFKKRVAKLYDTKNGTDREVPLSSEAVRIIRQMPKESDVIFNIASSTLDSLFRKMKAKCSIENLRFHDTRHEAITRLAKKLDVLPLARMVGHRDLKMLMTYYNETAEELAKKLD